MSLEEIEPYLEEAEQQGVREYYLTGGEVFILKELETIVERILRQGPVTILTNGTLITEARAARFAAIEERSPYSLEFRVSIDGYCAEENDPIRGDGTFEDATKKSGTGDARWSTGAVFFDIDGDLDLYVANYVKFTPDMKGVHASEHRAFS